MTRLALKRSCLQLRSAGRYESPQVIDAGIRGQVTEFDRRLPRSMSISLICSTVGILMKSHGVSKAPQHSPNTPRKTTNSLVDRLRSRTIFSKSCFGGFSDPSAECGRVGNPLGRSVLLGHRWAIRVRFSHGVV